MLEAGDLSGVEGEGPLEDGISGGEGLGDRSRDGKVSELCVGEFHHRWSAGEQKGAVKERREGKREAAGYLRPGVEKLDCGKAVSDGVAHRHAEHEAAALHLGQLYGQQRCFEEVLSRGTVNELSEQLS
ncbi:hypothetical protein HPP92_021289 [Vanilla planifolia]|uniref:Uncharacterized protein n=1 Tax=Vanilla planifolia TaxID=51239 RepID=A0A835Q3Y6_VANPL|nr:hypothetical protein HPP92_021289 [Vanilla planifolia]